jgi:hypothetical protein
MRGCILVVLIHLIFGCCCKVHAQVKSLVDFADAKSRMDNFLLEVDALSKESAWTFSSLTALEVDNKPEFVEQVSGFVMENPAKKISYSMVQKQREDGVPFRIEVLRVGKATLYREYGNLAKAPLKKPALTLSDSDNDKIKLAEFFRAIPDCPSGASLSFQVTAPRGYDPVQIWLKYTLEGEEKKDSILRTKWKRDEINRSRAEIIFDDRFGGLPTEFFFCLVDREGKKLNDVVGHSKTVWAQEGELWFPRKSRKSSSSPSTNLTTDLDFEFCVGDNFKSFDALVDWKRVEGNSKANEDWFEIFLDAFQKAKSVRKAK